MTRNHVTFLKPNLLLFICLHDEHGCTRRGPPINPLSIEVVSRSPHSDRVIAVDRLSRFVSLTFAAFLTLSAAGAFAAPVEAAGVPKGVPKDDDAAKDGTPRDVPSQPAVNSGACFFAADKGKSLVQGSCDVRALQ